MVADLFDPFDSRVGPTKAQQEAWEARKFGTLESLRPMSREECDQAIDKIAQGIDDEQTRRYLEANRIRQPIITPASRTALESRSTPLGLRLGTSLVRP
jgi:hypothetical protein